MTVIYSKDFAVCELFGPNEILAEIGVGKQHAIYMQDGESLNFIF